MRVLVTGAAGFLGHHAVEHILATTNWDVVGLASFRHRGCPLRLRHLIEDPRFKLVQTDLAAPITDRIAVAIGRVDAIVNYAAESHVDRSIEDPRPFFLNNVEAMLTVMEFARTVKPKRFIQVSTDEVYGPAPLGHRHAEWEAILPSNPYSASKAAQEAIAISYWRTYGVPVVITNCMNLVGERQDREKFLPMLIRGIANGQVVPLHGMEVPDGRPVFGSRMYLHARNLADAICWLLKRPVSQYPNTDRPDRWNIVGEREIDNYQMAQIVASILEEPLHYRVVDFHRARPGHDRRYALDGTKLATAGWKQPVDLEQSLERTVRWTMSHREWMQ